MQYDDAQGMPSSMPPQYVVNMQQKGILDRPNADFMTDENLLKILRTYMSVVNYKKISPDKALNMLFDHFWGFINQQANLTFYERQDKIWHDIDFELTWYHFLMSIPPGSLTQGQVLLYRNLKKYSDIIFFRSVGINNGKTNERIAQQTSINQNITSAGGQGQASQGLLSKMFGKR